MTGASSASGWREYYRQGALPLIAPSCDTQATPGTTIYLPNVTKTLGGQGTG